MAREDDVKSCSAFRKHCPGAKREILFEIYSAREQVGEAAPDSETAHLLNKAYSNLIRMWAEV